MKLDQNCDGSLVPRFSAVDMQQTTLINDDGQVSYIHTQYGRRLSVKSRDLIAAAAVCLSVTIIVWC